MARRNIIGRSVGLMLIGILGFGSASHVRAGEPGHIASRRAPDGPERIGPCPISPIRVADRDSVSRFRSLAACRDLLISTPVARRGRVPTIDIPGSAEGGDGSRRHWRGTAVTAVEAPSGTVLPIPADVIRIVPERAERPGKTLLAALRPSRAAGRTPRGYRTIYDGQIAAAARRHAIDPLLIHAIIRQESNYDRDARSDVGAVGLMQIMPATGARFGTPTAQLRDPERNIDTGARLLRVLHRRFAGDLDLVLAAYNAGEGAIARYGNRVPPYRETRAYVRQVGARYASLLAEN